MLVDFFLLLHKFLSYNTYLIYFKKLVKKFKIFFLVTIGQKNTNNYGFYE